jgi:hypothetical protein
MQSHRIIGKAGVDGVLHLDLPVGVPLAEFEIIVVLQPRPEETESPDNLGWPPNFFEETAGAIQDPTFRRHDPGDFESRIGL